MEIRRHRRTGCIVLQHIVLTRIKGIIADALMDAVMATGCIADAACHGKLASIRRLQLTVQSFHPAAANCLLDLERLAEIRQDDIAEPEHAHHWSTSQHSFLMGAFSKS